MSVIWGFFLEVQPKITYGLPLTKHITYFKCMRENNYHMESSYHFRQIAQKILGI